MNVNLKAAILVTLLVIPVWPIFSVAQQLDLTTDKIPPRIPLHEFTNDRELMTAFVRGVRAMKARKPSDPLSWFYQAAIHGVSEEMVLRAAKDDPAVNQLDKRYWNQCPHGGQNSANFLPWHRAYTHHFERILRVHTNEPRFSLPYWDYSLPERNKFPKEFGSEKLPFPVDGDDTNPLWHEDRNTFFAAWDFWPAHYEPYLQLTPEAVDWSRARDSLIFFGESETEGLGGGIADDDPMTRGLLESYPHDPLHRLIGVIVPSHLEKDPNNPLEVVDKPGFALGMSAPPTAGFDPIFSIHHSNIDRLWVEWSLIEGKSWGKLPSSEWFEEKPWFFFEPILKDGQLIANEVNRSRKDYFDHRKLGIAFKYEALDKTPLQLPEKIPTTKLTILKENNLLKMAELPASGTITTFKNENLSTTGITKEIKNAIAVVKKNKPLLSSNKRVLMRIYGLDISSVKMTGFDVYLSSNINIKPDRASASYVGSIALFRHNHHNHDSTEAHHHEEFDTFDVTKALLASGADNPADLHVIIAPVKLLSAVDVNNQIGEIVAFKYQRIEFFQTK